MAVLCDVVWQCRDIPNFTGDGYKVNVKINNYQFYRKIRDWKLSWTFWNGEYIWDATVSSRDLQDPPGVVHRSEG